MLNTIFHRFLFLASYAIHVLFQVCCEFTRVVGKSLQDNFFDELGSFSPRLMDLFVKKKGLTGQLLQAFKSDNFVSLLPLSFLCSSLLSFLSSLLFIFFFLPISFPFLNRLLSSLHYLIFFFVLSIFSPFVFLYINIVGNFWNLFDKYM